MDAEPVLRHFGAHKKRAIEVYAQSVNAALARKSQQEYYVAAEGRMLGSDEFLDEVKHRIGDYMGRSERRVRKPDLEAILKAAEKATGLRRKEFCTNSKTRPGSDGQGSDHSDWTMRTGFEREMAEAWVWTFGGEQAARSGTRSKEGSLAQRKLLKAIRSAIGQVCEFHCFRSDPSFARERRTS